MLLSHLFGFLNNGWRKCPLVNDASQVEVSWIILMIIPFTLDLVCWFLFSGVGLFLLVMFILSHVFIRFLLVTKFLFLSRVLVYLKNGALNYFSILRPSFR